jgi:hypothetical protein
MVDNVILSEVPLKQLDISICRNYPEGIACNFFKLAFFNNNHLELLRTKSPKYFLRFCFKI